jgi:hypothetical protein
MEELFKETAADPVKRLFALVHAIEKTYLSEFSPIPDENLIKFLT